MTFAPGTPDARPPADDRPDEPTEPAQRTLLGTVGRVLAGLAVAASFGVWVYAYSGFADRPPPDLMADTSIGPRADAICTQAVDRVDALPSSLDAADGVERRQQIIDATQIFEGMVDDLRTISATGDDAVIYQGWLGDWEAVLADRYRYADQIAADPDAQYLQTVVVQGERLDRRVTRVANTNKMYACRMPSDVG